MKKCIFSILVLAILFFSVGCSSSKKLDSVAYTTLRYAIAKSTVDNSGEISVEYLDKLKSTVKELNKDNNWFSSYDGTFYGLNKDTDSKKIDYICNSDYCAKFIAELKGANDYYLTDYSFESNNEKGYVISIIK